MRRKPSWTHGLIDDHLTPTIRHIGSEIGNIDLRVQFRNRQVQDVHDALLKFQVIFFRDQEINSEQHMSFAKYFGPVRIHVDGNGTASQTIEGYPAIPTVS